MQDAPARADESREPPEVRRQMQIPPIREPASVARFARGQERTGMGRRYALEGDARPGDVLALAGGALVRDRNENGLIDGYDVLVTDAPVAGARGVLVDVRA
jgi:hypothetical protein